MFNQWKDTFAVMAGLNPCSFMPGWRAGAASGGISLWTPSNMLSFLWLDADDESTITDSSNEVSQWNDKSGEGNNATQSTASLKPTTGFSINDLNAINFNSDAMTLPLSKSAGNFMFSYVVDPDGFGGGGTEYLMDSETGRLIASKHTTSTSAAPAWYDGAWKPSSGSELDSDNAQVLVFVLESGTNNGKVYLNGTLVQTATYTQTAIGGNVSLGSYWGQSESFMDGLWGEVVFSTDVTNDTRQRLEGYMAWKWGLQTLLPVGHPYKSSPPTV